MAKTYIYHDGKMWGRTPHTQAELLALHLPLSTYIMEVGGDGSVITLESIMPSLSLSAADLRRPVPSVTLPPISTAPLSRTSTSAPSAPATAAAPESSAQLAVLRDISSNVRVLTWLAIIPYIFAAAGFVLYFLAR